MASADPSFVAEVGQASDITLLAFVLGLCLVIGLLLVGLDAVVGRLHRRRDHKA